MSSPKGKTCLAWESIIVTKLKGKENTNHSLSNHRLHSVKGQRASWKAQPLAESSRVTWWPKLAKPCWNYWCSWGFRYLFLHHDSPSFITLLGQITRKLRHWTLPLWLLLLHNSNLFNLISSAFTEGTYNKQQRRRASASHVKLSIASVNYIVQYP